MIYFPMKTYIYGNFIKFKNKFKIYSINNIEMPYYPIEHYIYIAIKNFTKHDSKLRIYLLEINTLLNILREYSLSKQYVGKTYNESPWLWPTYTRLEKLMFKAQKRSNLKTTDETTRENITTHLRSVHNSAKLYYEKYHNERLVDEEEDSDDEIDDDKMALSP